ncbi:MAG TPA: transglycosylase SLT domain-containing protein [Chthonomonadaceae bacterium]|nr:transglycosylase SLT domain-containing protein [Chthonomonadaceae bacterium]
MDCCKLRRAALFALLALLGMSIALGAGAAGHRRKHRRHAVNRAAHGRDVERLPSRHRSDSDDDTSAIDDLPDPFFRAVIDASSRLRCRPRDLLAIMMRESGVNPAAHNRSSGAVGLIQFLPGTLSDIGWHDGASAFRELDAAEQIPWIEKFLRPWSHYGLGSTARLYQAIFLPISLRDHASASSTLISRDGKYADWYARNRQLDLNGDGRITVSELQQAIRASCRSEAWREAGRRLAVVGAHRRRSRAVASGGRGRARRGARRTASRDAGAGAEDHEEPAARTVVAVNRSDAAPPRRLRRNGLLTAPVPRPLD